MRKQLKTLAFLFLLSTVLSRPSFAQGPAAGGGSTAPATAPSDSDDLELPAKGTAAPTGSASASATAAPSPAPSVAPTGAPAPASNPSTAAPGSAAAAPPGADIATSTSTSGPAGAGVAVSGGSVVPSTPTPPVRKTDAMWPLGLRLGGYIQAQFETNQQSEDQLQQGGAPLNQNRFSVRRARLRLDRDWEFARATLELDANTVRGVTFGIRRAEGSVLYRGSNAANLPPLVMLTAGVMDIPFGYELLESTRERAFMERTAGGLAIFPTDMDVGVRLSGAIDFFRYAVAVMNGEPVDNNGFPRDPNAAKDVLGRFGVDVAPTKGLSLGGGASFATGKGFHAGQDAGKNQLVWRDADQNGVFSSNEVALVPASSATPSKNFDRWVLGLDLEAALETGLGRSKLYGEVFVAKNYDRGLQPADPVVTGVDVRELGAYVGLLQDVTQYGLLGFRASVYNPNQDTTEVRTGQLLPLSQAIWTLSPLAGLTLRGTAKLLFQYDIVIDKLGRDSRGVPANAKNNAATLRLQVEL